MFQTMRLLFRRPEPESAVWKEIFERKDEFQGILSMLLDYDEKSGRYREYGEPELHHLRRAISAADPAQIRVYARDLGNYMYYLVAELLAGPGLMATAWVHEDGIRLEREEHRRRPQHPVHEIACVTDLFERHARVIALDPADNGPGELALSLMLDDSLLVE